MRGPHLRPARPSALRPLILVVAASASGATACGQAAPPVAPTTVAVQTQARPLPAYPIVTMTETGGNGPAVCQGPRIGSVVSIELGIEESGSSIHLILDPANYATDETGDYHGSVSGTTIQATGLYYGNDLCVGAVGVPAHNAVPSTFTGSMSADGTTLTGHEVRTLMTAEQTVTYEYDWKAVLK